MKAFSQNPVRGDSKTTEIERQFRTLAALRDALLPRLNFDEQRVDDAERLMERAVL